MPIIAFAPWQLAATSAKDGFHINGELVRTSAWQNALVAEITGWEKQLDNGNLKTFPKGKESEDLKDRLKALKRAVGKPLDPSGCDREAIVSSVRNIAETVLLRLSRCMRKGKDTMFNPQAKWGNGWPNEVIKDLQQEKNWLEAIHAHKKQPAQRAPKRDVSRGDFQFDDFYTDQLKSNGPTWIVQGENNVSRLVGVLAYLRNNTNEVPRYPSARPHSTCACAQCQPDVSPLRCVARPTISRACQRKHETS